MRVPARPASGLGGQAILSRGILVFILAKSLVLL